MIVGITNSPRDYAWGSHGAISALLGVEPSGAPEAELWLGAHPGSPSRIIHPQHAHGADNLADWIATNPEETLGVPPTGVPRLPFLLKVLAAASPLSLQAHPTSQQAIAGFAREQAEGIPIDAPDRNYKDAYPKPEIIYALEDGFEALCGFRPVAELRQTIARLIELDAASRRPASAPLQHWLDLAAHEQPLREVFEWLISKGQGVPELIPRVVEIARENPGELDIVVVLADAYPGDPGIVISLMLHHVSLHRGEVLFLPAGNIHAYIRGLGVELMNASDNVLRGGLTPKYVDVAELLGILDFTPVPAPYLRGTPVGDSVIAFRPPGAGFELLAITGSGSAPLRGPAILFCENGSFRVSGASSSEQVTAGESYFVTADEGGLEFDGEGSLFLATSA